MTKDSSALTLGDSLPVEAQVSLKMCSQRPLSRRAQYWRFMHPLATCSAGTAGPALILGSARGLTPGDIGWLVAKHYVQRIVCFDGKPPKNFQAAQLSTLVPPCEQSSAK